MIGIECEDYVPKKWNISRFLRVLGQPMHLTLLKEAFDGMVRLLGECVPDLGRKAAGDATHLNARRNRNEEEVQEEDAEGLPQPSGGRKEYADEKGQVTKVPEWLGYKFHLLVDVKQAANSKH